MLTGVPGGDSLRPASSRGVTISTFLNIKHTQHICILHYTLSTSSSARWDRVRRSSKVSSSPPTLSMATASRNAVASVIGAACTGTGGIGTGTGASGAVAGADLARAGSAGSEGARRLCGRAPEDAGRVPEHARCDPEDTRWVPVVAGRPVDDVGRVVDMAGVPLRLEGGGTAHLWRVN